jgi:ACR3 family arsenite transporter
MSVTDNPAAPAGVVGKLSTLDRFLPAWIAAAMVVGLLGGRVIPGPNTALNAVSVDGIYLPIAIGLLIMMYPVIAKVRYDRLYSVAGDKRLLWTSLVLNWIIGPALMFALAWLLLPDQLFDPERDMSPRSMPISRLSRPTLTAAQGTPARQCMQRSRHIASSGSVT